MSFLAAAGSIAAAEALAAAAMAGTTAAQVAAATLAAEAAAAAATATAAAIPTAAGIGGAMPSAAMLSAGASSGIAPGVVAPLGLEALVVPAATTVAGEGIAQLTPKAGGAPSGGNIAKPPVSVEKPLPPDYFNRMADSSGVGGTMTDAPPVNAGTMKPSAVERSPFNRGTAIGSLLESAPSKPTAYLPETPFQPSPFNAGKGGLDAVREPLDATVTNLSRPVNELATDPVMQSIADSAVHRTPLQKAGDYAMDNKMNIALGGLGLMQMMPPESGVNPISEDMIRPYTYSEEDTSDQEADPKGREKIRYKGSYSAGTPYKAAQGGLLSLHRGGNFLSGGGDGMSDDIPAMIGTKQPARLADGEFVIPADVVSHIGNGSSKAGAEKLYAMMDKIRQERTGRKKQSPQINAAKYLPR
jgi:hypothetical protein